MAVVPDPVLTVFTLAVPFPVIHSFIHWIQAMAEWTDYNNTSDKLSDVRL